MSSAPSSARARPSSSTPFGRVVLFNVRTHYVLLSVITIAQFVASLVTHGRPILGEATWGWLSSNLQALTGASLNQIATVHVLLAATQFSMGLYLLSAKLYLLLTKPDRGAIAKALPRFVVAYHFVAAFGLSALSAIVTARPAVAAPLLAYLPLSAHVVIDAALLLQTTVLLWLKLGGALTRSAAKAKAS